MFLLKREQDRGFWHFRFSWDGKRPEMGLGAWPDVSLAAAREAAAEARDMVRKGINPIQARKKAELARQGVPTLEQIINDTFEARKAGLRKDGESGRWLSPLKLHVIPKIGNVPVTDIDQNLLADTLRPLWQKQNPTAVKAIGRLKLAMEHALDRGYDVNVGVVASARRLLGESGHMVKHHPAMPWQEVPAFYQSLGAGSTVRRVLSFMIAVGAAARTMPVRFARYDQINGDEWKIPGEMMKGRRGKTIDFRIPLNDEALKIIEICQNLTGGEWLFPGPRGKPITDVMTSRFMLDTPYRPHGFRSSFREWMAATGVPFEIAETAIAHRVGNKITQAYLRDDYWEKRKVIMHDWANHLTGQGGAEIIEIKDAR